MRRRRRRGGGKWIYYHMLMYDVPRVVSLPLLEGLRVVVGGSVSQGAMFDLFFFMVVDGHSEVIS